jgi:hypothetical protein
MNRSARAFSSGAVFNPGSNQFFPRVGFEAIRLFLRGCRDECSRFQPPDAALVKPGFGFRPELIAVAAEAVDLDRATDYGPKSACTGFVPQISRVIYGAGKNALPRRFDEALAVWRPEAIGGPAHERFDSAHFGAA